MTTTTLKRLKGAALITVAVLTINAAAAVVTAREWTGCCGIRQSAQICDLDGDLNHCPVGGEGEFICSSWSSSFPNCCEAGGYCLPPG